MDLAKNRGLLVGGGVVALLAGGGILFWLNNPQPSADAVSDAPPVLAPRTPGTPRVPKPGGGTPITAQNAPPKKPRTSWDGDPSVGVGGASPATDPGFPQAPIGAATAASPKPKPIVEGRLALDARRDPFVTFLRTVSLNPPAYSLVVPQRLASPPPYIPPTVDGVDEIGPIPAVTRRVSGIVSSNGVTAILETGEPGGGAETVVVQPGSRIKSYVAGIDELTVESITSNGLTLREDAPNRRSVQVKLSPLPTGVVDGLLGTGGGGGGGRRGGGAPGFRGGGGGYPGAGGSKGGGGASDL